MKNKGFTLIELLVVVSIIGVLATVVLGSLGDARSKTRDVKRLTELRQLETALNLYFADTGAYPLRNPTSSCGSDGWLTPLTALVTNGSISAVPIDPINTSPLCYNYNSGPNQSGWFCDGKRRSDYEYAFFFSLENENPGVDKVTAGSFSHCILGPIK